MMKLFPLDIAEGEAFCNRTHERKRLANNIKKNYHTVIMAPRRYGKTSLIRQVLWENNLNYEWVDFLSVTSRQEAEDKIAKAAQSLLEKLAPETRKFFMHTRQRFQAMDPKISLSAVGQSLSLELAGKQVSGIDDMLIAVDRYAQKKQKQGVLVFDEFQQISELPYSTSIEAFIKHAIERSGAITYIFSGSNRHLLVDMFNQKNRPLYRICQIMTIDRIAEAEYTPFLNKAAQHQWGCTLEANTLQAIFQYTQCHPYYVNNLCSELWNLPKAPTIEQVQSSWTWCVNNHKGIITADLGALTLSQQKVISALAQIPTKNPDQRKMCVKTHLSANSLKRTVKQLLNKEILYVNPRGEYQVMDPALRHYVLHHLV